MLGLPLPEAAARLHSETTELRKDGFRQHGGPNRKNALTAEQICMQVFLRREFLRFMPWRC